MKTIITIVLLSAGLIYSQAISDSTQIRNKNQEKEKIQNQKPEIKQLQDKTGQKQNPQTEAKKYRKNKDVFIDKDGDGISDNRAGGMGINKLRKRFRGGNHGSGSGGGNGNGGNGGRK